MVQEIICDNVRAAGPFSVMADECKDASKREQLAIAVRYVDPGTGTIHEHFLTMVEVSSLTAESLTRYILETLKKHSLDPKHIVSQAYDGASVMSGRCVGVQERVREFAPYALYIHCYAHNLNLALVDCVQGVADASEFFSLLQSLYVFMSTTKAHALFIEKQKEIHPKKQIRQLQRFSDTRWACRQSAVAAVCITFDALLETLEDIATGHGSDHSKAIEATGLLHKFKNFKFLLCLIVSDKIFSHTRCLSEQLQSINMDLAKAAELVVATMDSLQDLGSDDKWDHLYEYVESVANLYGIEKSQQPQRNRRIPGRFQDVMVLESTGARDVLSSSQDFKTSLFYPMLATFLSELRRRFNSRNVTLLTAMQACNPKSNNFLTSESLNPLVEMNTKCYKGKILY